MFLGLQLTGRSYIARMDNDIRQMLVHAKQASKVNPTRPSTPELMKLKSLADLRRSSVVPTPRQPPSSQRNSIQTPRPRTAPQSARQQENVAAKLAVLRLAVCYTQISATNTVLDTSSLYSAICTICKKGSIFSPQRYSTHKHTRCITNEKKE